MFFQGHAGMLRTSCRRKDRRLLPRSVKRTDSGAFTIAARYLFTTVCLGFTPLWDSFSLPDSFICQLTKENSPHFVKNKKKCYKAQGVNAPMSAAEQRPRWATPPPWDENRRCISSLPSSSPRAVAVSSGTQPSSCFEQLLQFSSPRIHFLPPVLLHSGVSCAQLHPAKGYESSKFINSHEVIALKKVFTCSVKNGLMYI